MKKAHPNMLAPESDSLRIYSQPSRSLWKKLSHLFRYLLPDQLRRIVKTVQRGIQVPFLVEILSLLDGILDLIGPGTKRNKHQGKGCRSNMDQFHNISVVSSNSG